MNTTTDRNYWQPALIGGAVMGVLSSLPIVSAGNLCCCMWVVSGGLVAAYVLQQATAVAITPAEGALAGLFAGLAGAAIQFVISIPLDILMLPMERAMAYRLFDFAQNMSPEMRDFFERFAMRGDEPLSFFLLLSRRLFVLLFMLVIGAAFSTIGGVIGAALFGKKQPPPGTIDVTPSS